MTLPPTEDLHLFNLGLKLLFVVAFVAIAITVTMGALVMWPSPPAEDLCWWESNIQLGTPEQISGTDWEVEVEGASSVCNLTEYRIILLRDGARQGPEMNPLAETTVGNTTFVDLTNKDKLGVGDYFIITTWAGGYYELVVVWRDSANMRGGVEWET
jgi:hypothetical protein